MRTLGAEGDSAGELRIAGGLMPSVHDALYLYSYQLSIDIDKVLVPKLVRGRGRVKKKEERTHPGTNRKGKPPEVILAP